MLIGRSVVHKHNLNVLYSRMEGLMMQGLPETKQSVKSGVSGVFNMG